MSQGVAKEFWESFAPNGAYGFPHPEAPGVARG